MSSIIERILNNINKKDTFFGNFGTTFILRLSTKQQLHEHFSLFNLIVCKGVDYFFCQHCHHILCLNWSQPGQRVLSFHYHYVLFGLIGFRTQGLQSCRLMWNSQLSFVSDAQCKNTQWYNYVTVSYCCHRNADWKACTRALMDNCRIMKLLGNTLF